MPNYANKHNKVPYSTNQLAGMQQSMNCNLVYPEVYYKVQPYVMFACDQMQSCGNKMTQSMLDQVGENIYTNVCIMHPDIEEYARNYQMNFSIQAAQLDVDAFSNGGLFRRRGLFKDFVDLLLLNELTRRGAIFF